MTDGFPPNLLTEYERSELHRFFREERDAQQREVEAAVLRDALNALDDLLAWVCNDWKWNQEHYDQLEATRERLARLLESREPPEGGSRSQPG